MTTLKRSPSDNQCIGNKEKNWTVMTTLIQFNELERLETKEENTLPPNLDSQQLQKF